MNMNLYDVDFDFIPQYGMRMLPGVAFSNEFATDSTKAFVINETTVKDLGYASAKDAIGKKFNHGGVKVQLSGLYRIFISNRCSKMLSP